MLALVSAILLMLDPGVAPVKAPPKAAPKAGLSSTLDATPNNVPLSVAVTLECTARASGQVENCAVLGETHPGLGFGEAAIVLMRDARVDPGPRDIQFARTIQFTP